MSASVMPSCAAMKLTERVRSPPNRSVDPASRVANVTAVALEFGFTHLGRFAELHRQTFEPLAKVALREGFFAAGGKGGGGGRPFLA